MTLTIDYTKLTGARMLWEKYPERLQKRLLDAMNESLIELTKEVKERVPVKTGTLRRSWNPEWPPKANSSGAPGYSGRVVSNLSYAAYQEFGFQGVEQVKAHERSECFGRQTRPFMVPAHSRQVDYAGKPYARPALAAVTPRIVEIHQQAVQHAVTDIVNG
jgi:hypothetical protein